MEDTKCIKSFLLNIYYRVVVRIYVNLYYPIKPILTVLTI